MAEFAFLVGLALVVGAVVWGFMSLRAWRLLCVVAVALAKLVSVASTAIGGGLLTCGVASLVISEGLEIGSPSVLIGTGVGLLVGGLMLLWLTLQGGVPQLDQSTEPEVSGMESGPTTISRSEDSSGTSTPGPTARLSSA
jgi:hypothetical protein